MHAQVQFKLRNGNFFLRRKSAKALYRERPYPNTTNKNDTKPDSIILLSSYCTPVTEDTEIYSEVFVYNHTIPMCCKSMKIPASNIDCIDTHPIYVNNFVRVACRLMGTTDFLMLCTANLLPIDIDNYKYKCHYITTTVF